MTGADSTRWDLAELALGDDRPEVPSARMVTETVLALIGMAGLVVNFLFGSPVVAAVGVALVVIGVMLRALRLPKDPPAVRSDVQRLLLGVGVLAIGAALAGAVSPSWAVLGLLGTAMVFDVPARSKRRSTES